MVSVLLALQVLTNIPSADPFAVLQPSVTITADDRRQLDRGEAIARVLPGRDLEVAIFSAVPVNIDGDRLVAWMRRIDELKRSAYVLAIGRFSNPPRIEDLSGLALDDAELSEIEVCRPGSCGLKLSATEMAELQRVEAEAHRDRRAAVQHAFRRIVLRRVHAYLAEGHAALAPYEDHEGRVWPATRFALLLGHSTFLTQHLPRFAEYLSRYPRLPMTEVESFVYWSKERLATTAIISATHVSILHSSEIGRPDVIVAGKEIFATHYVNASLGLTILLRGDRGGPNYLVYVNRSEVDMLGGTFGGLIRWFVQRRLKAEAGNVLQGLRRRLESGEPPAAVVTRLPGRGNRSVETCLGNAWNAVVDLVEEMPSCFDLHQLSRRIDRRLLQ
jgi:hypothetical protein